MRANQLRLWFASMAMCRSALRRLALQRTQFAKETCGAMRPNLLEIGVVVRTRVRRITFAIASGYAHQRDFALAPTRLSNAAAH